MVVERGGACVSVCVCVLLTKASACSTVSPPLQMFVEKRGDPKMRVIAKVQGVFFIKKCVRRAAKHNVSKWDSDVMCVCVIRF